MRKRTSQMLVLLVAAVLFAGNTDAVEKQPLSVLYLARKDETRTTSFQKLFEQHFQRASVIARQDFEPEDAAGFDVVILDWPQSERLAGKYESPLGELEKWSTPTVFLGSAGLQMAGPWRVIGGAG